MSTPTPTDPREEEIKHLRAGCEQWRKIANVADAELAEMIANRKELESTNSKLAAEIAELKAARDEANESVTLNYNTILELRRIITEIKAEFDICRSALGIQIHEKIPEQTPKFGSILVDSVGSRRRIAPATENEEKMANELATLRAELEAARKERDEAKAQFQKARELKEKYFWELGQIEVSIDGEGKIEGTGWSVAHKKVLELISIRDEANAFTKHVGGPTFKDSVDVILRTKSQDEDKIAEMFDIIKRTGADLDTALAAKDAAEKERDESREHAKNGWRMCDQYRVMLDREKVQRNAAETDRKQLIEVVKFYCDPNNFTVTVWEDETQDGKCWSEPAKDHGLAECYGPTKFGDFGIRALETLESLTPAPTQDPPAGGVTISNETVGIIPTATTPTEASPDVSALGAEAASHPISTEKKGGDEPCHKTNALAEDAQCSPEVTHTTALVASNSPADVPSEGRGECSKPEWSVDHEAWITVDVPNHDWITSYTGKHRTCRTCNKVEVLPTEGSGA